MGTADAAGTVPTTRVTIAAGARSVDVVLPQTTALYEALRVTEVDVDDPAVRVLDSTGTPLDVYRVTAGSLADGAVVHVVRVAPRPRSRGRGPVEDAGPEAARPAVPWWHALVAAAGLVAGAVALLEPGAAGPGGWALAGALVVGALALAVARRGDAAQQDWTTAVVAVVGFGAAALTVPGVPDGAGRLAVVAGLVGATAATTTRWAVARRHRDDARAVAGVTAGVLASCAGVTALAVVLALPAAVPAALVLGGVPLALRAIPGVSLDVPDEQLLDVTPVARTVSTVRAPVTEPLGRVNERAVHRAVALAEHRRDAGAVLLGLAALVAGPVLLLDAPRTALTGWAALAAVLLVALALALGPRSSRSVVVRWASRVAGTGLVVVVAVVAAWPGVDVVPGSSAGADGGFWAALVLLVAMLMVAVGTALGRGWRSVAWSRAADVLDGLVTVLALPVALLGAGAVELLRQAVS